MTVTSQCPGVSAQVIVSANFNTPDGSYQGPTTTVGQLGRGPVVGAMAPEMRKLAADSARRALQYVQPPAMRKMMIEQYRAAGIEIPEDE